MPATKRQSSSKTSSFTYSLIRSCRDSKSPATGSEPWTQFTSAFESPSLRNQKDGPAWLPAQLGDQPNEKGNLRHDGNVTEITAIVFDLDGKDGVHYSAADLKERLEGLEYLAHTTFNNTPKALRWRVILPLKSPITPEFLPGALAFVAERTGLSRDTCCDNPSRLHYFPACPPKNEKDYQVLLGEGERISPPLLREIPPILPQQSSESKGEIIPMNKEQMSLSSVLYSSPPIQDLVRGDSKGLISLNDAVALEKDRGIALAVARSMKLPEELFEGGKFTTKRFRSPLPWRDDADPSCYFLMNGSEVVIHDHGDPHDKTYSLPRLAMVMAYGKPLKKGKYGPLLLLWSVRLLIEAGVLEPALTPDLPPCPGDVSTDVRKVYEGFKLLWQCKRRIREWAENPTTFSQHFVAAWCGISSPTAAFRASKDLMNRGIIHICKKEEKVRGGMKPASLFLPGPHHKHPTYKGRKPSEEERHRRELGVKKIRRIARKMDIAGDPVGFSLEEREEFRRKARSDKRLSATERFLVGCWENVTNWKKQSTSKGKG